MKAPFTTEQIEIFELYQKSRFFHPYTCGNPRCREYLKINKDNLYCEKCDYTQDWAHDLSPALLVWRKIKANEISSQ